jgi:hypothetical protein
VRNHVKLDICLFVMNFNSRGFSLRVLYCVVDTGYGLGRSVGDCRPALLEGQKFQMVKTQSESHFLLAKGSVLLCTNFNVQIGAG